MRFPISITVFLLCLQVGTAQIRIPAAELETLVMASLKQFDVPGCVVVIVQGDQQFVEGYGTSQRGTTQRPTAKTVFPLASCTKSITTTLAAMLVDESRLAWDDPVRKHLPTYRINHPHVNELVTLRDLFAHRTGVRGHDLLWYRAPWSEDEILRRTAKLPVELPFRGQFEYSTLSYLALGRVIASSGNRSWRDLVHTRIATPLGWEDVSYSTKDEAFARAERAVGHRRKDDGSIVAVPWYAMPEPNAAGSINLSGRDLAKWMRFHLSRDDETKQPHTPMRLSTSLQRLYPDTTQMSYGMGWIIHDYRGHIVQAHGGMIDGFRVQIALFPKDSLAIGIMNNLHDSKMNVALANTIADRQLRLSPKDWNRIIGDAAAAERAEFVANEARLVKLRRANVPPSLPLTDFVGEYSDDAYGTTAITLNDNRLQLAWSSFRVSLEHWEGDTFRVRGDELLDGLLARFALAGTRVSRLEFLDRVFTR